MSDILLKLLPIFLYFGLGIFLKRVGVANRENAEFLLKLVFFVTLPAMVLLSLSQNIITLDKLYLPFINICINLSCMGVVLAAGRLVSIQRKTMGTMLVGTMISNNVFMFPFIMAGFGRSGFADAVMFDFGNGLTTATITYLMALRYGSGKGQAGTMILKLIQSPLFWAVVGGIGISTFTVSVPSCIRLSLEGLGPMTSPLILISLGIFFKPEVLNLSLVSVTILIRIGLGLSIGTAMAYFLGLTGQTYAVVILCSAAPVGFMTLTFASITGLDKDFASQLVSASILSGLIYIPILMFFLGV